VFERLLREFPTSRFSDDAKKMMGKK
jgi:outer membrane protein assembly factor BamD (BamD/ComL family)